MRVAGALLAAAAALAGCDAGPFARTRPVALELTTPDGRWRVEGAERITLEGSGWEVSVADSAVAMHSPVPMLEKLVLEVRNTSPSQPLYLEAGEIVLSGLGGASVPLGPRGTKVLRPGESEAITYAPGLRAEVLPHPFVVRVTVFRRAGFADPQRAVLRLY
jgi:hypothetical protein